MTAVSLFSKLTQIRPNEIKGALISFFFIFMLMASYMVLRPVRDALPSDWSDVGLAVKWSISFAISTLAVSIYNFAATKISVKRLVPLVFIFFALIFFLIYCFSLLGVNKEILGKTFYIWTSVFSVFHFSVFWSFMSQGYSREQSKRIFGFINTGASAGALIGPLIVILLLDNIPLKSVLLLASGTLIAVLPLIKVLNKMHEQAAKKQNTAEDTFSPNPFSGFTHLFTNKQLRNIALFIFLFAGINTFFYVIQSDLLAEYPEETRRKYLGWVDFATNGLTILLGIFAASRITKRFGLSCSISIVPHFVAAMLLLLSMDAGILMVIAMQVLRKAGNYSITRPAREVLFTGVSIEDRFKAKPIIDVAVYRGSDVFWIWSLAFLGDGYINLNLQHKLWVGACVAIIWGFLGIYLGRKHEHLERMDELASNSSTEDPKFTQDLDSKKCELGSR